MRQLATMLRELRQEVGLSQNALAEKAEVSPAFVYKLEAGEYSTLSIDKSRQLAKGLGMTFRDFLEAVGLLEDSSTPQVNAALASALRQRKLTPNQVKQLISLTEVMEKSKCQK
jgi:transcriptional regulator with XRE-family HTH domain